jgi:hypothetical protein
MGGFLLMSLPTCQRTRFILGLVIALPGSLAAYAINGDSKSAPVEGVAKQSPAEHMVVLIQPP